MSDLDKIKQYRKRMALYVVGQAKIAEFKRRIAREWNAAINLLTNNPQEGLAALRLVTTKERRLLKEINAKNEVALKDVQDIHSFLSKHDFLKGMLKQLESFEQLFAQLLKHLTNMLVRIRLQEVYVSSPTPEILEQIMQHIRNEGAAEAQLRETCKAAHETATKYYELQTAGANGHSLGVVLWGYMLWNANDTMWMYITALGLLSSLWTMGRSMNAGKTNEEIAELDRLIREDAKRYENEPALVAKMWAQIQLHQNEK